MVMYFRFPESSLVRSDLDRSGNLASAAGVGSLRIQKLFVALNYDRAGLPLDDQLAL